MLDLQSLQNITVPRFALTPHRKTFQVHGFADASMNAYGCCIYLRSMDAFGVVKVKLFVAKSRVAPAKKKQLPRLELCAAHLLSNLWTKIHTIFATAPSAVYFWTDSLIVLHWISTHSSKLSTFVGNRVAEIQENTMDVLWKHVPSLKNPADIVSRGCAVKELETSMWFGGLSFLLEEEDNWPSTVDIQLSPEEAALEKKKTVLICKKLDSNDLLEVIEKYSSYTKLVRVFAYVLRVRSWRLNRVPQRGLLVVSELDDALLRIVHLIQQNAFSDETKSLQTNRKLKGPIKWLNPFVQEINGILLLRVGGRLEHANIPEECKHSLLLPKNCNFTHILVRHLHLTNFHAGPKALVALVRNRFWIINAREIARQTVRKCVHCVKYRPKLLEQVMGDLPPWRLTPSRPFLCCGVDFCGPIYTHYRIRGKVPYKTYVTVFVCFSTKAVHLEAVSDLSADAFIAALKRMIGRRGLPRDIHCDNATNFVGARSKLVELRNMLFKSSSQESINNFCTNSSINFHFIPPRAPHFGGIWEAAVNVAKGHLYRSLSGAKLTFEELSTALVEIEAIMNSRPITPMSSDPSDLEAITPAHLLIGSSLKTIPEPTVEVPDISFIQRWRRINAVKTHFWQRWSTEYVHELQGRAKWTSSSPNVKIGSLVIVHEDNVPPQKWLMGRITNVVHGADGRVRVADVKTAKGEFRRPIRKLAALPS